MNFLEKMMDHSGVTRVPQYAKTAFGFRATVVSSGEFKRIDALPRRTWKANQVARTVQALTEALKTPGGEMELRDIQAQAIAESVLYHGGFFPIGVGGGKALISLLVAVASGKERPLLVVPAQLRDQTNRFVIPQMNEHWGLHPNLRVIGYSELSLAKNANLLERLNPDIIILDECFPGWTRIKTARGIKKIEDIKVGEKVLSVDDKGVSSWRHVAHVFEKKTREVVDFCIGGEFVQCTPNHPFLTLSGWVNAEDLNVGDQVVRVLPRDAGETSKIQSVLQSKLFDQVANHSTRVYRTAAGAVEEVSGGTPGQGEGVGFCDFKENDREQSIKELRSTRKDFPDTERYRTQAADPRGQWSWPDRASEVIKRALGLDSRVRLRPTNANSGLPAPLQNRHCEPRVEGGGRSGWLFSLFTQTARARQKKRELPRGLGLVSVTSIERSSIERLEGGRRVYNLEVEGPHTYVLGNGIVVHNCHRLKSKNAGRTRRVMRYFQDHPETECVAMSGTISSRSIKDYAHIVEWCLKGGAPVPLRWQELTEWADCIDEKVPEDRRVAPGALKKWYGEGENARQGYRRRLVETPGVIASSEGALGTSLRVVKFDGLDIPHKVTSEIERMWSTWETPNGDIITEPIELWRHTRELALGFYYRWDPPAPREWLDARRAWKGEVREHLKYSKEHDTELQVWNYAQRAYGAQANDLTEAWVEWSRIKGTFTPNPVAEWLSDFALKACGRWLNERKAGDAGIVWTEHRVFGKRLIEYGWNYFGAGDSSILDTQAPGIVASIAAHGEGKNLERYSKNLVVSPPTSGKVWEQMLGRTHRPGQEADEVTCEVFLDVEACRESFNQARRDARYLEDSLGNVQKLNYADVVVPGDTEEFDR